MLFIKGNTNNVQDVTGEEVFKFFIKDKIKENLI